MLKTVRQLRDLLDAREARSFWILVCMIFVMGLIDMVGVASILPFLAVLSDPTVIKNNEHLAAVYRTLGFSSIEKFLMFCGTITFAFIVFSQIFKTITSYSQMRFSRLSESAIGTRLLVRYLGQPYEWFLSRNSSQLGSNLLSEVDKVVTGVLLPTLTIVANAVAALFLIVLLIYVQPIVAIATAVVIGGTYGFVFVVIRRYLTRAGNKRIDSNQKRYRAVQEAMGAIKDIKLFGLESPYVARFTKPSISFAEQESAAAIASQVPRYLLEVIIFGGLMFLLLTLLATGDGRLEKALPVVGIYAFAGIRLFPAMQQLYAGFTAIRFNQPALDALHADYMQLTQDMVIAGDQHPKPTGLNLCHGLELVNVHYKYPSANSPTLRGLTIMIDAKTTIGVVGRTGAGKTTMIDTILGLLVPQIGQLTVDGVPIDSGNVRRWQQSIGYVPQTIFLEDDTVAANIAFGRTAGQVDMDAVERASRIADLHDFVMGELPRGYQTKVGERGIRLSGGQRQRIGIARALYHDPEVLVFDEATSALDNLTERAVMDAVRSVSHKKTVIIVAHRLSTVKFCDRIFLLEHGACVGSGRYSDLIESSASFRDMAAATT